MRTIACLLTLVIGGIFVWDIWREPAQLSTQATTTPSTNDGKWTPVPSPSDILWPDGITLVSWRQDANGTNIMEYRDAKEEFHVANFKFVPVTDGDSWSSQIQFKVRVRLLPGTTRPGIDVPE